MARGFLAGVLGGGVISTAVLGVVSVLAPPPTPPEVSDAAPGAVQTLDQNIASDSGKTPSQPDTAPVQAATAQPAPAPDPDTLTPLSEETQTSAAQPATGAADSLADPAAATDMAEAPDADAPVLPSPQANAPAQPQPDSDVALQTEPAAPPTPQTNPQPLATAELATDADTALPAQDSNQTGSAAPSLAEAPTAEDSLPADATAPAAPASAPATQEATAPAATTDTDTSRTVAVTVPQITEEAEPESEVPATATPSQPAPAAPTTQVAAATGPSVGRPATSLIDRGSAVVINRPQAIEASDETETTTASLPTLSDASEDQPPIDAFAQAFDAGGDKPLMSIVLIDDGTTPTAGAAGIAALRSFPYPLSFAVDSQLPDAAERMALYRDNGFEVLAMIDMPAGAQPVDAETTLGAILPGLPEVVGVLEGTGTGFQESRDLANQVSSILAQTGHGLLTQSRGLNTMAKLARKEGVPAAPIFRDFDSKGQTATVIRRFLDQAAFRAGQEGAVVMLGRMRPDTISALLLWGLQDRANSVALAPVSAVLKREPS